MNNFISAIIIYSITFIYFLLSNKTIYICTLKYYSISASIYDDKTSLTTLINHMLIYRTIIRYIRIHLIFSSIFITVNFIVEISLIVAIINLSMLLVLFVATYDILSLKARLKALEDKLYRIYNNLK